MKPSFRLSLPLALGATAVIGAAVLALKTSSVPAEPLAVQAHTAPGRSSRPAFQGSADAAVPQVDEAPSALATRSAERHTSSPHAQGREAPLPPVASAEVPGPVKAPGEAAAPTSPHARRTALAVTGRYIPAVSQGGHPLSPPGGGPVGSAGPASSPALPLAHQITDSQAQQIAPDVPAETLAHIQDQFAQEVGADHLDPAEPEYSQRWEMAKATAADRIRTLYGWAAYAEVQRQAALAATTPGQ